MLSFRAKVLVFTQAVLLFCVLVVVVLATLNVAFAERVYHYATVQGQQVVTYTHDTYLFGPTWFMSLMSAMGACIFALLYDHLLVETAKQQQASDHAHA